MCSGHPLCLRDRTGRSTFCCGALLNFPWKPKGQKNSKVLLFFSLFFPQERELKRNCICIWVYPTICSLPGTAVQHIPICPACTASPACSGSWFSCFHDKKQWDVIRGSSFPSQWDADKYRCRCHVLRYLSASLSVLWPIPPQLLEDLLSWNLCHKHK